jgi:hypothetical protein
MAYGQYRTSYTCSSAVVLAEMTVSPSEEPTPSPSRIESAIVERGEKASMDKSKDQDRGKGATEQDPQNQGGNTSMQGQLGHRDEDAELKNADSDLSG